RSHRHPDDPQLIDATALLRLYCGRRLRQLARQDAAAIQQRLLMRLVRHAAATRFGQDHEFARLRSLRDFQAAVPPRRYEEFWTNYWQPAFPRLVDCTWPGLIEFFALSSGTSSGATKFIPLTHEMLRANRRAGLDLLAFHLAARPRSRVFAGRNLL